MKRARAHTPPELKKLYHQAKWNKTKRAVIEREHGICQRCHKRITGRFIVHHKHIATANNFFDMDNLVLLCQEWHNYVTFHEGINRSADKPVEIISKNHDLIKY